MTNRNGVLLGMLAETSLHPGAGQAADVVDLPVSREGASGLPQIPETGLKGALRQWAKENGKLAIDDLFGKPETGAGELMISTARLLCLPVRRLDGPYAWVTTPYLLERLKRDSERCGCPLNPPEFPPTNGDPPELLMNDESTETVFLEEYSFKSTALTEAQNDALEAAISPLVGADIKVTERLLKQIAIMSEQEFFWFAQYALPVDARNVLDEAKMSKNLWYEETVPPDALFYSVIMPRNRSADAATRKEKFIDALMEDKYIQIGGNETVGQGWVRLAVHNGDTS